MLQITETGLKNIFVMLVFNEMLSNNPEAENYVNMCK